MSDNREINGESAPDKSTGQPRWKTILLLTGFGIVIAFVIFLGKGPPIDDGNSTRVIFTTADLAQVSATYERTWNRKPTLEELQITFDKYVRSEVLYQEALARELDRNDPTVRMSMVRKITSLAGAQAQVGNPGEEELNAFFELRSEQYRLPAVVSLIQLSLNSDKKPEEIEADAKRLLAQFNENEPLPDELADMSYSRFLPIRVDDMSDRNIVSSFGENFKNAVITLPEGEWFGPVTSAYGFHLVKIIRREEPRIPLLSEVRDRVVSDLLYEGSKAAEEQFYAELLPRYEIIYDSELTSAFETLGEQ